MIVRWEASALTELANAWLESDSDDRRLIVVSAAEIDRQLLVNPNALGESRSEDTRVFFVPPLGVLFEAEYDVVSVLHVWKIRQGR